MKKYLFLLLLAFYSLAGFSQEIPADSLLLELNEVPEEESLLPEKMLLTQRMLWGEKGLYRKVGIAPSVITAETRQRELKVRRTMLKIHQTLGIATASAMVVQGFLGSKIYNPETYSVKLENWHKGMATGINIGYASTALMSFTAPPGTVYRKRFDNIKLHKALAYVHLTGMITTNVLARRMDNNYPVNKKLHKNVALGTFGAYTLALASIKVEF